LLLRRTDRNDGQTEAVFGGLQGEGRFFDRERRGELTTAQLATKHGIHQTMVGEWKKQAMDGLTAVFSDRSAAQETAKSSEAEVEKLHAKIGQLVVERDFLAKASGR
jgi:transposase